MANLGAYLQFFWGGNRIGSLPFEGGFRGIELELEATPSTLKYTLLKGLQNKAFHGKRKKFNARGLVSNPPIPP